MKKPHISDRFCVPGEPIPYLRMTQGEVALLKKSPYRLSDRQFKKVQAIRRYFAYRDYVCLMAGRGYPAKALKKVYLDVFIYFTNGKHGDPDNVRKGIQDALFARDSRVAGAVDFDFDSENPRCEVLLRFTEEAIQWKGEGDG